MKTDQFVKVLKELCASWDLSNSDTSDAALEIQMWRKYFLRKEMKPYSEAKKNHIEACFMTTPSETMNRRDPRQLLKEYEEGYDNK